jgi:pimeloyl-ACP methyl ester carboxylesterase
MRLALDAPARLDRLVLACTSARARPWTWQERAEPLRREGVAAVADVVLERWFTPAYPDVQRSARCSSRPSEAYAQCCEAIRDWDAGTRASLPTTALVISAADDLSTPPERRQSSRKRSRAPVSDDPDARHSRTSAPAVQPTPALLYELRRRDARAA